MRAGGAFLPRKGEPVHALTGGEEWRPARAGAMPPHFVGRNSALLRPRLAARTAPAPFLPPLPTKSTILRGPLFCEKRECAVHGGREKTGARKACLRFYACLLPAAQCKRGFGCRRIDSLLFSLPLTWRLQGWCAYRFLSVGHSVGAAAPGGPFLQPHPSTDRPSRGRALSRPAPLGQPLF